MPSRIYRDVALERLSSPDALDRILRVTDSKTWMAQLALFGVLAVALVWGFVGRIPSIVAGQGVIIRKGGVLNIASRGSGIIKEIRTEVGDRVSANQVLATLAQPEISEKVKGAQEALDEAERDRERSRQLLENEAYSVSETLQRKRTNTEGEIASFQEQLQLATAQVRAQDELFADGIVTKQKTIEARQVVTSLEAQIANRQAEIKELDAEQVSSRVKVLQSDAEKELRVQDLQRHLREVKSQLELAENVVSPCAGEVLEVKISTGATIQSAEPLVSIQPDVQDLQILVYIPAEQVKNVKVGMYAKISPSTVKAEEYGFIQGTVTYVSEFPDTPAELMRNFENEVLVKSLTDAGPITEVHVAMVKNPQTVSGYQWSSRNGPSMTLSGGTLCTAEIETRSQAPIRLVLPFLRRAFGLT
jgi:HlyD family secretion protein